MSSIKVLRLSQALKSLSFDRLIIHSLDLCLYQASVQKADEEFYLVDEKGRHIRTYSIAAMQDQLEGLKVDTAVLRQQSAYDEMVGQPGRDISNQLEVPLARPESQTLGAIDKGSRTIQ